MFAQIEDRDVGAFAGVKRGDRAAAPQDRRGDRQLHLDHQL
jgi:hypothetical protein